MKANRKAGLACLILMAVAGSGLCAADPAQTGDKPTRECRVIRANGGWQGTGVVVRPSEFVCVAADGLWSHGPQGIQAITPFYGPEGFAKDDPVSIPEVVSRVGALVGKIDGNVPFVVERQLCFIPASSGELMLSMNDAPGTFGNNLGTMRVQIATFPTPSIPNRINLRPQDCMGR
jgi:hypothetical protein